jgi:hypothetical protein
MSAAISYRPWRRLIAQLCVLLLAYTMAISAARYPCTIAANSSIVVPPATRRRGSASTSL